ncbi:MAG: TetR/AcrR family transcriptional regulator [Thermaerobacter sp.]|nr:TetR/AcrR family transcriptional regulator [Thermaerobacter sp.]
MTGYDQRREQVLDGSAQVFARKGYDRASIRDIAKAVEMSPGGLYHYCSNKQDLLYQLCERSFRTLIDHLSSGLQHVEDPRERLYTVFATHLTYFFGHPDELITLTENLSSLTPPGVDRVRELQRRYYSMVSKVLESFPSAPARSLRIATMTLFGSINWVHTWYRHEIDGPAETVARIMTDLFLNGMAPAYQYAPAAGGNHPDHPDGTKEG